VKIRIGIHTGPVIAGNLGSYNRFNYTAVGDSVNLASRLQGVNKVFNTGIILSEATYTLVKDLFAMRELDTLKVVGKTKPVKIYQLLAVKEHITDMQKALLRSYQEGLSAYKDRSWEAAVRAFEESLKVMPDDGPSQIYLARCQTYLQSPPPLEWDGIFQLEYK
jgi:adenylate cyclase